MATGLFGKMPAHGDFVRRTLPRSFVAPWDEWLSAGIERARAELADEWDAAWEAAPVWRFRLSPGVCGPDAVVGVMATSQDMVGRRFPLTLAATLPAAAIPPPDDWYQALELALASARQGLRDADEVAALLPLPPPDDPDATLDGRSLFWSEGLPARAMPAAAEFGELLAHPQATQQQAVETLTPVVAETPQDEGTEVTNTEPVAAPDETDAADDMLALVIATRLDGEPAGGTLP